MAIALELIFSIEDDDGDVGTTTVKVPNGFSLAQYGEFGASLATLKDKIIDGRISGADICTTVDISALLGNTPASGASDVEEIAAFQFATSEARPVNVNIPAMKEALVPAGSDDINQADIAVAAFISAMENGIATPGGTIQPTDVAEVDITTTVFAREKFRASGKRR